MFKFQNIQGFTHWETMVKWAATRSQENSRFSHEIPVRIFLIHVIVLLKIFHNINDILVLYANFSEKSHLHHIKSSNVSIYRVMGHVPDALSIRNGAASLPIHP